MAPTFAVRDANGAYTLAEGLGNEVINPLAQIDNTYNRALALRWHSALNGQVYNFAIKSPAGKGISGRT